MIRSKTRIELLNENFLNFIMTSVYFWGNSLSLIGKSQVQVCVNFKVPCIYPSPFLRKVFLIYYDTERQRHLQSLFQIVSKRITLQYTCTCTDVLIFFLIFHYSFSLFKSLIENISHLCVILEMSTVVIHCNNVLVITGVFSSCRARTNFCSVSKHNL